MEDHKRTWNSATISNQGLGMYKRNPSEFLQRFLTVDEVWIHHYERTVETEIVMYIYRRMHSEMEEIVYYYSDEIIGIHQFIAKRKNYTRENIVPLYWADSTAN